MKKDIDSLQNTVEKMVRNLGGYWPPLSAIARVLEELGEVGEYIIKRDFYREFAKELSDVLIITTCIANQYYAQLTLPKKTFSELDIEGLYTQLIIDCGELARIINAYEGSKKLKSTEHPTTVEEQISLIFYDLLAISSQTNVNILEQTKDTVAKALRRDKNRFEKVYDPVSSENHDLYLKRFQSKKKIWGLRESNGISLENDLEANKDTIARFFKFGAIEGIDRLVMKISNDFYDTSSMGMYENSLQKTLVNEFIIITRK